jgi:hypothetical protein
VLPADLPAWIPATPKRHTTGREHLSFPGLNKWNLGLFPLIICKQYKKLCIIFGWGKDVCWIMVLPGFYTIWDSISIFLNQRALTSTLAAIETATYKPSIGMRRFPHSFGPSRARSDMKLLQRLNHVESVYPPAIKHGNWQSPKSAGFHRRSICGWTLEHTLWRFKSWIDCSILIHMFHGLTPAYPMSTPNWFFQRTITQVPYIWTCIKPRGPIPFLGHGVSRLHSLNIHIFKHICHTLYIYII